MATATEQEALALLLVAVHEANIYYENCRKAAAEAARHETEALNSLNTKQKAFDAELAKIRAASPYASEWKSSERNRDARPVPGD